MSNIPFVCSMYQTLLLNNSSFVSMVLMNRTCVLRVFVLLLSSLVVRGTECLPITKGNVRSQNILDQYKTATCLDH